MADAFAEAFGRVTLSGGVGQAHFATSKLRRIHSRADRLSTSIEGG
jgi:hypothetical protein